MRALRALALAFAGVLVLASPKADASSVYSEGGLGEPALEEQARIRALGGAGVAEHGPLELSLVNPASLADVEHLVIEGTILPTMRRIRAASSPNESARETTFPSVRGAIALPGKLTLGAAYVAGTDADFQIDRAESSGASSSLRIDGTGGLNYLRVSLARKLNSAVRVGLDYDVIAGSYREVWTRSFTDSGLVPARDTLDVRYPKRGRWRFGAQLARGGLTLGLAYETSQRLPLEITRHTIGASDRFSGKTLTLPAGVTAGFSAPLGQRLRTVAQYRRMSWNRSSLESDLVDFRAQERISAGLERKRGTEDGMGFWSRIPIRIGGYVLRWPELLPVAGASDISGGTAPVNEWALTLGTGLISKDKGGALDFSLEMGSRGNRDQLGVSEQFARLGISLTMIDDTWKGSFRK